MRKKELRLVITFPTTTAAIAMEACCVRSGVPGRLIPTPTVITAGCGMAWSAPPEAADAVTAAARSCSVDTEAAYYLEI